MKGLAIPGPVSPKQLGSSEPAERADRVYVGPKDPTCTRGGAWAGATNGQQMGLPEPGMGRQRMGAEVRKDHREDPQS